MPKEASIEATARDFTDFAGHGDRKSRAITDCLAALATAKARRAKAEARRNRNLLRATTMNGGPL